MKIFNKSDLSRLDVRIEPVYNSGNYSSLFRGLPTEVELKEARLNGSYEGTGRLFFYTLDSEKVFYLVAIRGAHLDTSHSR